MGFWRSLNGEAFVEIIGADPAGTLSALHNAGIAVFQTVRKDDLTLQFIIRRQDYRRTQQIVGRRGDRIRLIGRRGLYWTARGLLRRPVLVIGLLVLLVLGCFLPTRILFFRVEGNESVPTRLILEQAAQCGITFGASRREVRSEKMKNALLEALPQLQWAGINTNGCVATISVREREIVEPTPIKTGVSSIVATRDGVILSCTVTRGNTVCKVGQAVKAGEVLVSGYTDCGLSIRASQAEGEIYAQTERQLSVSILTQYQKKAIKTQEIKKYSLIIGKSRINFYKNSGILDATCDKMYVENYVTLPGGFQLPVALVTEVWTYYDCTDEMLSEEASAQQLSDFAAFYLKQQMIAGKILSREEAVYSDDGIFCLDGQYACQEMIGRVQKEEIIAPYGKHE